VAAAAVAAPTGVRAGAGDGGEVFFSARSPSLLMAAAALAEAAGPGPNRPDPVPGGPDPDPRLSDLSWRPVMAVAGAHACAGGGAFFSAVPPLMALAAAAQGLAVPGAATSAGQLARGGRSGGQGARCLQLWSRRRHRRRQGAPDSGPGVRIRRPQGMGRSPTWWGTLAVMTAATSAGARADDVGQMRPRRAAV